MTERRDIARFVPNLSWVEMLRNRAANCADLKIGQYEIGLLAKNGLRSGEVFLD
jgi:hypothetical protein